MSPKTAKTTKDLLFLTLTSMCLTTISQAIKQYNTLNTAHFKASKMLYLNTQYLTMPDPYKDDCNQCAKQNCQYSSSFLATMLKPSVAKMIKSKSVVAVLCLAK